MKTLVAFFEKVLLKIFGSFIDEAIETKLVPQKEYLENMSNHLSQNENELAQIIKILTPEKIREVTDPSLHEIKEKGLTIRTKFTNSNKDEVTLLVSKPCWEDGRPDFHVSFPFDGKFVSYQHYNGKYDCFPSENVSEELSVKEFIEKIFATHMIAKIQTTNSFEFELTKSGALTWDEVLQKVLNAIASLSIYPDVETSNENESDLTEALIAE